ncbi:ABC transporter substrate-binding protein [Glaciihabitans arcticus]|uniref:Thiamine pyrimidine synthase n=1 Tax=Glaciihabitans arcticus TaxID=2668039 RepID=A0A4Q9GTC1_9MICO|nr:ABC transporter substrate-binding protein [Glaciihabitans arcticus]TBN57414.1 ABC transporter substrate-binding protein [Glaciihabitans arcticus]
MASQKLIKRATLLTLAAFTAVTLAGCAGTTAPAETGDDADYGSLSIQLSWIKNAEFAGEFFADSEGYFEDAGFSDVTLVAGPTATEAAVIAGESLVGLTNAVSVAPIILDDAPIKIIGTTYQKNPFTILSLATGGNILTPADLVGKKIGVQAGGNETLFDALLAANDIDPDSVTKVPVEYDPAPLVNGEVDGFLAYVTNESIIVESEGFEVANLLFADNGLPFVAESFVVTQDSIDNDREKLKAFLYAEILGWKDAIADAEAGAKLAVDVYGKDLELDLAKETKQAEAQNELLIQTDETATNGLFTISDELIAQNLASLSAAGYDLEADQIFDMSLLAEVYEEHPELLE